MAIVLVNKDGTSNAKAGDIVVTGGGLYQKNADGSSTRVGGIDTATGKSGNYADVLNTFSRLVSGNSGGSSTKDPEIRATAPAQSGTQVHDSLENYDDFTLPLSYDYSSFSSGESGSASMSKVVGYAVVGLVLLVVADKLIGK